MFKIDDRFYSLEIIALFMDFPNCKVDYDSVAAVVYSFCLRSPSGMLASAADCRTFFGSNLTPLSNEDEKGLLILTGGIDTGLSKLLKGSTRLFRPKN